MEISAIRHAIDNLTYGKRLPGAVYVWSEGEELPGALGRVCDELRRRLEIAPDHALVKFHLDSPKISFLAYPKFWTDPHPSLSSSVVVDLVTGKVRRDSYSGRTNPPILHRKETFLPPGHPKIPLFRRLTEAEENAGLLSETTRIGFRLNWDRLVAEKGCAFSGHSLVRISSENRTASGPNTAAQANAPAQTTSKGQGYAPRIDRERTAIVRGELSKPVKLLLETAQLKPSDTFFDYGCGLGSDMRALVSLGYSASGWDPNHAPDRERSLSEVVNLGFVINVIEDPAERVEVLESAWQLRLIAERDNGAELT